MGSSGINAAAVVEAMEAVVEATETAAEAMETVVEDMEAAVVEATETEAAVVDIPAEDLDIPAEAQEDMAATMQTNNLEKPLVVSLVVSWVVVVDNFKQLYSIVNVASNGLSIK